jgi:hypothetical protein
MFCPFDLSRDGLQMTDLSWFPFPPLSEQMSIDEDLGVVFVIIRRFRLLCDENGVRTGEDDMTNGVRVRYKDYTNLIGCLSDMYLCQCIWTIVLDNEIMDRM